MGWQFTAAEWIGGVVLIVIMSVLVRLTYPAKLVEQARRHPEAGSGHEHEAMSLQGETLWQKLRDPRAHIVIAHADLIVLPLLNVYRLLRLAHGRLYRGRLLHHHGGGGAHHGRGANRMVQSRPVRVSSWTLPRFAAELSAAPTSSCGHPPSARELPGSRTVRS
jgi:hypothetical protein